MAASFRPVLVGMFDSPYVRRVAVTLHLYDIDYEHQPWSVFAHADKVRRFNPLGRVPALKIGPDEVLIESTAIIDYLDEQAGPGRRMTPAAGSARRQALKQVAVALGVCDKAVGMIYERQKRAASSHDADWDARLSEQLLLGGQWLEQHLAPLTDKPDQAQLTAAIARRFVAAHFADCEAFLTLPALSNLSQSCEALPSFVAAPFADG